VRVLLLGGAGLLGHALHPTLVGRGHAVVAPASREVDIRSGPSIRVALAEVEPDWVVNLAAFTAVDAAERRREEAFAVNALGAGEVAAAAAACGVPLLQMSTDYVFDGARRTPYPPEAPVAPLSVYGASKAEGEERVRAAGGEYLILRSSWLFGASAPNFVDRILERAQRGDPLAVVDDQTGAPTWTDSLAAGMVDLMEGGVRGTHHLTDRGEVTWWELAVEALALRGFEQPVRRISSATLASPARRPRYSVLALDRTESFLQREVPPWTESLNRYLGGASAGRDPVSPEEGP